MVQKAIEYVRFLKKAGQLSKRESEGGGGGHGRRLWLKQRDNIDGRSVLLADKYQTGSGWKTYCGLLHEAGLEPTSDAIQVQVDAHQAQLPSSLDQLVWLHHQPLQKTRTVNDYSPFQQDTHEGEVFTASAVLIHLKNREYFLFSDNNHVQFADSWHMWYRHITGANGFNS